MAAHQDRVEQIAAIASELKLVKSSIVCYVQTNSAQFSCLATSLNHTMVDLSVENFPRRSNELANKMDHVSVVVATAFTTAFVTSNCP